MNNNNKVVGLFESYEDANDAVIELGNSGYTKDQIDIMVRENVVKDKLQNQTVEKDVGEGTVSGARAGALVGGIAGTILGVGALLIPGVGPVITLGTLSTAIGSAAVGAGVGAAGGGVLGSLTGLGLPKEEAEVYAEGVKRGGILVVVDATERDTVEEIFHSHNAVNVQSARSKWSASGWKNFDESVNPDASYPML